MQELNIYGDVSGGWIFDQMDKKAHEEAIKIIGDCVTISSSINFIGNVIDKNYIVNSDVFWSHGNKACINILLYNSEKVIATASFLFIKRK